MTHIHTKGQRSVGSKDRVESDGRTDRQTGGRTEAIALPPVLTRSVNIYSFEL